MCVTGRLTRRLVTTPAECAMVAEVKYRRWLIRYFPLYAKKRGRRRTGSRVVGGWALMLSLAGSLAVGLALLTLVLTSLVIPEWRVNQQFVETTCTLLDKRLEERVDDGTPTFRPRLLVRYQVQGVTYDRWTYDAAGMFSSNRDEQQIVLDRFVVGQKYPAWCDPWDPQVAVLARGYTWSAWLLLLLPTSFLTVGAGGLVYTAFNWGKSAERRAASPTLPSALEAFERGIVENVEFPSIPSEAQQTNSPGTTLRFRLPATGRPVWALWGGMGLALMFNVAWMVFAWMAMSAHFRGERDWFLTLFTVPWVIAGAVTGVIFTRQLLIAAGIGPTILETSHHPLALGGNCRILLSQAGRLRVQSLRLVLACEERATFQQGTNTRTEQRRVIEHPVFARDDFEISQELPFEVQLELPLPAAAMHSFRSEHNEVAWQFVVEGRLAGWPDFQRAFPVVVFPTPPRREVL